MVPSYYCRVDAPGMPHQGRCKNADLYLEGPAEIVAEGEFYYRD